jgi:hypothetical protein
MGKEQKHPKPCVGKIGVCQAPKWVERIGLISCEIKERRKVG